LLLASSSPGLSMLVSGGVSPDLSPQNWYFALFKFWFKVQRQLGTRNFAARPRQTGWLL
jgi:hypothetical protein